MNQIPSVKDILRTMDYGTAPEADAPAQAWLDGHGRRFGHWIGGAWTEPAALFDVADPATGALLARVSQGDAAAVDAAVTAARAAFPAWSQASGDVRARHLYALARTVQRRERLLAVLESLDNGKPIRESRDLDIPLVARHFLHHAGWAELVAAEFPGQRALGVCGQIVPWNFPLLMLSWKIAPALAAGNTVVLKPAEQTPLTALAFADLCIEAGLPAGVVNIVTGDGDTGAALVAHAGVDKIAFTGSTEIGRVIRRATAGSGKRLTLELGGKSPFIVFDDSDLDSAIEGVVDAIWFNQGQVCCAGSRLLVQEGVADRFHAKLRARMGRLRVGSPLDKSIDIGAIVSRVQLDRIAALVAQGCAQGATCFQPDIAMPAAGLFYPPTLLTVVEPASIVATEEIFGPVLVSMSFRTPEEAVALANNTRYGLAASVWTENVNLALDVAGRLKAGVVWINATNLFDAAASFGGFRESGFGREGGRAGMAEYLAEPALPTPVPVPVPVPPVALSAVPDAAPALLPAIDRTAKMYVGGKQARPDGGNSFSVRDAAGRPVGSAGLGNRKDIRNAVEAAHKASGWSAASGHNRAQVLYFLAENLSARAAEFSGRLQSLGQAVQAADAEVEATLQRLFHYAAWADKYDGAVQATRTRHMTLAVPEPWGVMGVVCDDERAPLLGLVSLLAPALAMGNRVVAVPCARGALVAADLYQVLDTSDVPGGTLNIVTGAALELAQVLAQHDDVAAMWFVGSREGGAMIERESAGNLKATWASAPRDWMAPGTGFGRDFLRRATQLKTIWVPYGE